MARAMLAIIATLLSSPVQAQVLYLSCAGGVVLVPGGRPMKVDPQVIVNLDIRVVTIGNLIPAPITQADAVSISFDGSGRSHVLNRLERMSGTVNRITGTLFAELWSQQTKTSWYLTCQPTRPLF
jgi:hypothetical protein